MISNVNIWNSHLLVLLCMALFPPILPEEGTKQPKDYLLCRQCGKDLASADSLANLRSPAAVARTNESLFGVDQVQVQTLVNPLNINFRVVTVLESSCATTTKHWSSDHSWFPGYAWKPCICFRCLQHIGWAFEPLEIADSDKPRPSNKGFYALILDNIISELYSNLLLIIPQTLTVR